MACLLEVSFHFITICLCLYPCRGPGEVVKRMEAWGGDRVSPHTFRCLEAIHHRDDHQELVQVMLDEKAKPTSQRLIKHPSFGWLST